LHGCPPRTTIKSNIPLDIRKALHDLRSDSTIKIAAADKNMGIFIVSTAWYTTKCEEVLLKERPNGINDYCLILSDPQSLLTDVANKVQDMITIRRFFNFLQSQFGDNAVAVKRFGMPDVTNLIFANFYGLVKIHKLPVKRGCISACHRFVTNPLAKVIARIMHPVIATMLPQFLKDTRDFTRRIDCMTVAPEH
jgi:hypothetical protein